MRYPNAHGGLKKVFVSEILTIIASVIGLAGGLAFFAAAGGAEAGAEGLAVASAVGGSIFVLISGLVAIIALVMKLVGLNQAGKDEEHFLKVAFFLTVIGLVLSILGAVFSTNLFGSVCTTIAGFWEILIFMFVLFGIKELALALEREDIISFGEKIMWIYVIGIAVGAVANIISTGNAAAVLAVVGAILEIIAAICYLILLSKAVKMLEKA